MYAAALMLLTAGSCGECRSNDCHQCFRPHHSCCAAWRSFWCNLAPPFDCRLQAEPWPLEYPGARGRGWQAHDVAVTKHTPINAGPHAVPVVLDEHGLPHVIGYQEEDELADETPSPRAAEPIAPGTPSDASQDQGRAGSANPLRTTWRFLTGGKNDSTLRAGRQKMD